MHGNRHRRGRSNRPFELQLRVGRNSTTASGAAEAVAPGGTARVKNVSHRSCRNLVADASPDALTKNTTRYDDLNKNEHHECQTASLHGFPPHEKVAYAPKNKGGRGYALLVKLR